MNLTHLKGCGTALVTPFLPDGRLDETSLRNLVEFQISGGIDFLIPCGTTGESPVLSSKEHMRVVEVVLDQAQRRVPVLAGAGGNNTDRVREGIQEIEKLGADGILSVSPYYSKPTQEGIYRHYENLAGSTSLPILVYNVPGRTGSNVEPRTLLRLSALPNILGVKEASGSIAQADAILNMVPPEFKVFSGDDALTLPMMAIGACGVISVASNVIPRDMASFVALANSGDYDAAKREHRRLSLLMQTLFIESNPIPVKAALAAMGMIQCNYRLPLVPLQPENRVRLESVLEQYGLLAGKEKEHVPGRAR